MSVQIIPHFTANLSIGASLTVNRNVFAPYVLFDDCQAPMVVAGTFSKLKVKLIDPAGAGESWTVDLYVNGSASAITVTISDTDTDGSVETNVAVSAGDLVKYVMTRSSTSASQPNMVLALEFTASAANTYVYGFRDMAAWASTGVSAPFYGEGFPTTAGSEDHASITPTGTVTAWRINMADGVFPYVTTPGANTITYTLQKNGVDQDGTGGTVDTVLAFTGSTNTGNKSFSLSTTDGDLLSVKCVVSGTPGVRPPAGTIAFESSSQCFNRCGTHNNTPAYQWIVGAATDGSSQSWSFTESERRLIASSSFAITGLRVNLPSIPGGATFSVRLRRNGLTVMTADIAAPTLTASVDGFVSVGEGDYLDLLGVASGTMDHPRIVLLGATTGSARNLLTGNTHAVTGDDNFIAGKDGTIEADRSALFNLKSSTPHTLATDNTFAVYADTILFNGSSYVSGAGGAPDGASYVTLGTNGTLTSERVLTGTSNQIALTDGGAGSTITLSTPQNIHTSATPQFGRMGLNVAADSSAKLKIAGQYGSTLYDAGNSSTAITLDWDNGNTQLVTMTGNCTFTLSNPKDGFRYLIALKQDGTGSRTVTLPSSVKWAAGVTPTWTTTAAHVDIITLVWVAGIGASGNYLAAANLDYTPA